MPKQTSFGLIIGILVASLIGGIIGGGITIKLLSPENGQHITEKVIEKKIYVEESQVIDIIKEISPSIVSIIITKNLPIYKEKIFNSSNEEYKSAIIGAGSGFIVTADGLIITNRHVVDDPNASYTIILNDGSEYDSEIISLDKNNDIALIKLNNEIPIDGLPVIKFGNSDKIQVGQQVIAIGNALNEYENTVTTGVISAKGRSIMAGSIYPGTELKNLIQTDATITSGNSGGPLVNLNGEVIGINTAFDTQNSSISFAIPINDAISIIESSIK